MLDDAPPIVQCERGHAARARYAMRPQRGADRVVAQRAVQRSSRPPSSVQPSRDRGGRATIVPVRQPRLGERVVGGTSMRGERDRCAELPPALRRGAAATWRTWRDASQARIASDAHQRGGEEGRVQTRKVMGAECRCGASAIECCENLRLGALHDDRNRADRRRPQPGLDRPRDDRPRSRARPDHRDRRRRHRRAARPCAPRARCSRSTRATRRSTRWTPGTPARTAAAA